MPLAFHKSLDFPAMRHS